MFKKTIKGAEFRERGSRFSSLLRPAQADERRKNSQNIYAKASLARPAPDKRPGAQGQKKRRGKIGESPESGAPKKVMIRTPLEDENRPRLERFQRKKSG